MTRAQAMLVTSALAHALSWLLPVHADGVTLGDGGLPGWEAFRGAVNPLWPYDAIPKGSWWFEVWTTLSGLTNVGFVAALVVLARRPQRSGPAVVGALLSAVLINALWFALFERERSALRAGYYLWLGSFVLLTAAAHLYGRPSCAATDERKMVGGRPR